MHLNSTASRWDWKEAEPLHNLIMTLRLQDDPLKVWDAGQGLSWDPVHVDVVVLQAKSQQGRRNSMAGFTHRLHRKSTETHYLWTELHAHEYLTNTLTYISSSEKDLSSNIILTLSSRCRAIWFSMAYKLKGLWKHCKQELWSLYLNPHNYWQETKGNIFFS